MHVPSDTFRNILDNISYACSFSVFIDYKTINYLTYGDKLKSVWYILPLFGKCLIKWGYEYAKKLE